MSIVKIVFQALLKIFFFVYFSIVGKPKFNEKMKKTLSLYDQGSFSSLFQIVRLWDAPYEIIEKYIPKKGNLVDLGCGDGILANYIAMSRPKVKVWGVDINKNRIVEANKGIKNAEFVRGDITKAKVPKADAIILAHVLHHLISKQQQEEVLRDCISKLKPKGKLIIIEIGYQPFFKYLLTAFVDAFIVPILFEKKLYNFKFFYRSRTEWTNLFEKMQLNVKYLSAHSNKPFSHEVYICGINKQV